MTLEEAYNAYHSRLLFRARRLVGVDAAEDIEQDLWVRVVKHWPPPYEQFLGWLYAILYHLAIDYGRNNHHTRQLWDRLPTTEGFGVGALVAEYSLSFADKSYDIAEFIDVKDALKQLTPRQQEVLKTAMLYESYHEGAKALGMQEMAYRIRLWRARNRLKVMVA